MTDGGSFVVARIGIEPLPIVVWAAVAQGIAAALDDVGYDAFYRDDGAIVARRREPVDA